MKKCLIFMLLLLTGIPANAWKWSDDIITVGFGGGIDCTSPIDVTYNGKIYTSQFSGHNVMPDFHLVLYGVMVDYSSNFAGSPKDPSGEDISRDHTRYTNVTAGYLFPVLSSRNSTEKHMSTFSLYASPVVGVKRRAQLFNNRGKISFTDTYVVWGGAIAVRYKYLYLLGKYTNEGFGASLGIAF